MPRDLMAKREKVVEMFDPRGNPTDDPSKAARIVTIIYEDGSVVQRILGKPLIPAEENRED